MVVRILIAGFTSLIGGYCFLSGAHRLMSGLLLFFGAIGALFFGLLFGMSGSEDLLGIPVHGETGPYPFYILSVLLIIFAMLLVKGSNRTFQSEPLTKQHGKYLLGGVVTSLVAIFLPAFFWLPSQEKLLSVDLQKIELEVFVGTVFFLVLHGCSLYLFFKAAKGKNALGQDFMRRVVLTVFSVLHLDKIPALIAYLLIYSPESQVVFPAQAALAIYSYLSVGLFFWCTTGEMKGE